MDRKSKEEEKSVLLMKFFDYAESPIKEWIAEYLNVDVKELFSDYQDNSDVLGFQCEINNKYYEGYLVTMDFNDESYLDNEILHASEKYKKACSMLFDAVHQVFPAVTSTIHEDYKEKIQGLRPLFDNNTMSFKLYIINHAATSLQVAIEAKKQLMYYLTNTESELDENTKNNIKENISKCDATIETNTKKVLDDEEEKCKHMNKHLENFSRLYIAVEEIENYHPSDECLRRLPLFGLSYQDPEEESLIDKLKKQMNINE